jgi:hypothetical protein
VKHKIAMYVLAAAGLVFAMPAQARGPLPPYEIATIIHSTGLTPTSRPMLRGLTYVVGAIDGHGRDVRVVVDAQRGLILAVRPVMPAVVRYEAPVTPYGRPRYDSGYVPDPFYSGYGPGPGPGVRREVEPPGAAGPRVIYAPRDMSAVPSRTPTAAKPPAGPAVTTAKTATAPKAVAAAPAQPAPSEETADPMPTGTTPPPAPAASSALTSPPVQTLE